MTSTAHIDVPYREQTVHSPTDALRFVTASLAGIATFLVVLVFPDVFGSLGREISTALESRSDAAGTIAGLVLTAIVLAVPIILLVFFIRRKDGRQILLISGAAVMAAVVMAVVSAWLTALIGDRIVTPDAGTVVVTETAFYPYVAALTAAISSASPWMPRRRERTTWVMLALLVVIRLAFGSNLPAELFLALSIGVASGAGILFFAGSPNRRPSGEDIVAALERSRITLRSLHLAAVDARGSTPYFAETDTGRRLFIKTLSTDERSADLLFRLYRRLRFKNIGDEPAFSSLRREVEHEALLSYSATAVGVRTPPLVTVGMIGEEEYSMLLAYEALNGRSLDSIDAGELTNDVLSGIWNQVVTLHSHGIAHRDLRLANVFLDVENHPWLIDFGFSELAASDLLLDNDVAELVTSSAVLIGAARAVRSAVDALGPGVVSRAARRVQPEALSGATKTALKERGDSLDLTIRREIGRVTGLDTPPLDRVQRLDAARRLRDRG